MDQFFTHVKVPYRGAFQIFNLPRPIGLLDFKCGRPSIWNLLLHVRYQFSKKKPSWFFMQEKGLLSNPS
jgi:hypothetical protein